MSETSTGSMRAFSQFLATLDGGNLHGDLSKELNDLVAALQDAAGGRENTKGKIAVTFNFEYDAKSGMFEISGDYKVTPPKERRGKSVLWADGDNNLTPYHPKQQDMFVRDATGPRGQARDV
nr:hypothetical protein DBT41_09580 [Aerococcus urinae]